MSIQSRPFEFDAPALEALEAYDVDPEMGFMPTTDPVQRLPAGFDAWEEVVPEISALIRGGRLERPRRRRSRRTDWSVSDH